MLPSRYIDIKMNSISAAIEMQSVDASMCSSNNLFFGVDGVFLDSAAALPTGKGHLWLYDGRRLHPITTCGASNQQTMGVTWR